MLNNLVTTNGINKFIEGVPEEQYHADKTAVNSSSLRKILKSPAGFHSSFFGKAKEPTKQMKFGTLVHKAVLEGNSFLRNYIIVPDFGDMRTKQAQEKKRAWLLDLPQGAVTVTESEYEQIYGICDAILRHSDACRLLKGGVSEITGYYQDPLTNIQCRVRPDFLHFDLKALVDLKTTRNCSYRDFSKSIWQYRYDFQMAMYCEAVRIITGIQIEYPAIIAVEKEPPFEVAAYVLDTGAMEKGLHDYRKSIEKLKQCLEKNEWQREQMSLQNMSLPIWAFEEE